MQETFDYIEAYLAGELPDGEREAFERRMREDADFAGEVRLQQDTHQLLALHKQFAYKAHLQAIAEAPEEETEAAEAPVRPLRQVWVWTLAAAIVLLVLSSYLGLSLRYDSSRLAADATTPYDNLYTSRGDTSLPTLLQTAFDAYDTGNYALAANRFETLLQVDSTFAAARLYLGVSLLLSGQPDAAATYLCCTPEPLREPADWYLALTLLQQRKLDTARISLQAIAQNPDHAYQARAQQLLRRLDSPWRRLPGIR